MTEKVNELTDERKLATVAKILNIEPIPGADNIEKVFVRGWQCVAKKGEFKVGDLCVYIEVDSIMPDGLTLEKKEEWRALNKQMSKAQFDGDRMILKQAMEKISNLNTRPEFEFLRSVKFHIKTRRILGEMSQGICFPLSILKESIDNATGLGALKDVISVLVNNGTIKEDLDVTSELGVTQYIAPDPAVMGGDAAGTLTGVGLLISDEERLENLNAKYETMRLFQYFKTEKLEGTSCTVYLKNGKFGVCGRTVDFQVPEEDDPFEGLNSYWKTAIRLGIEEKMRNLFDNRDEAVEGVTKKLDNFAIQGELIGEGIQGNIYKLKGQIIRFYNAFYIDKQEYMCYDSFVHLIREMGLETVPILDDNYTLPENAIDLLLEADVTYSVLNPAQLIEGFVYVARGTMPAEVRITRANFNRLSFKAKSRTYDLTKK